MNSKLKYFFTTILVILSTNLIAQTLEIDFRLNTQKSDKKNQLTWLVDSKKTTDSFDAVTGASKKHSTGELKKVFFDKDSKYAPKGLYALLLFAVSPFESLQKDMLKVEQNGKEILISFTHRGNAYKIQSDKDGFISMQDSFKIFNSFAQNKAGVFTVKPEYADDSFPQTLDWKKLNLESDLADTKSNKQYTGKLKVSFKNDILKLQGKLKLEEVKKEEPKPQVQTPKDGTEDKGLEQEFSQGKTLEPPKID